jgi:hypothetical protein
MYRLHRRLLLVACLTGLSTVWTTADAKPEQYWLANGLRVVLDRDTRTPLVAVTLCVHAGGNENVNDQWAGRRASSRARSCAARYRRGRGVDRHE